ncbi:MAG: MerR family transcriptional regulator [Myxococcota bacterium]|jgi:hypothetical protein|nr:hypothetical protein [Deltaproteobacteria bacterium]MCP4243363.1 MerR family transcriptional regulator [bacterium]MDP6073748.1 MerR family transcriptional regulator [Myxococcota bacterium]MDP7073378.1 MerR family transcriptional regulator [Myxococcota bacterium]MDP7297859.1 MerR family transcriptional regulator [Myxococcota bacterium]
MGSTTEPDPSVDGHLRASEVRDVTGLTDRQLHEWDKRGALPHERRAGGHRRISAWDAMALSIASTIRGRYSIPLTKLGGTVKWMVGKQRPEVMAIAAVASDHIVPQTQQAADLVGDLVGIATDQPRGLEVLERRDELLARAGALDDPKMEWAVHQLCAALMPLYGALGELSAGFPVFLVTNLESHLFVSEPGLVDHAREAALPENPMLIRVDPIINRVLTKSGGAALPVQHRVSGISDVDGESLDAREQTVIDLLRERKFSKMTIFPRGQIYRIEVTSDLPDVKAEEIANLIQSHDYGSVLVKNRNGQIQRLTQTISIQTPASDDGTIPHRPGTERS